MDTVNVPVDTVSPRKRVNAPEPRRVTVITRDAHNRLHAQGTVLMRPNGDAYFVGRHGELHRVQVHRVDEQDKRVLMSPVKRLTRKEKKALKRARH